MRSLARISLGLLAAVALVRAVAFLVYALARTPLPVEVWYLEPKMAHLAWRVQTGARLYPAWRDYPYISNFFGPIYFAIVGLIGRLLAVDLDGLTVIGRVVTLASGLGTSAVLGFAAARRLGWRIGAVVAAVTLGSGAMIGYGLMVRPDASAGLLGTAGLLMAVEGRGRTRALAAIPLTLAIFTKQTSASFLIASASALAAEGRWRAASGLVLAVGLAVSGIIAAVTALGEPMFGPSLVGEAQTPWRLASWADVLVRLIAHAPDLVLIPVAGMSLWWGERPRPNGRLAAAVVLLAWGLAASGKHGSDLNYFLDFRIVQAWACATLMAKASSPPRPAFAIVLAFLAAASLVPGTVWTLEEARNSVRLAAFSRSEEGRLHSARLRDLEATIRDPSLRVLSDSAYLQSRLRGRAEFVDPWLFNVQVEAGLIEPAKIEADLERGCYDLVITFQDLFSPRMPDEANRLPRPLLYRARQRYRLAGRQSGLFLYRRSGPPDPGCPANP